MDRRLKFRKGLSKLYLPVYDTLCDLLPPEWAPYQGLRTVEEQNGLYKQGRERPGPIVTWAQGGSSAHNYGCATDWTLWEGGKPVWMTLADPRWATYQQACEKAGARWGGDWNRNGRTDDEKVKDYPHNELPILCAWKHVFIAYKQGGMTAAQEHIERNLAR